MFSTLWYALTLLSLAYPGAYQVPYHVQAHLRHVRHCNINTECYLGLLNKAFIGLHHVALPACSHHIPPESMTVTPHCSFRPETRPSGSPAAQPLDPGADMCGPGARSRAPREISRGSVRPRPAYWCVKRRGFEADEYLRA
jgi:hypothetical protein